MQGYFEIMRQTIRNFGVTESIYADGENTVVVTLGSANINFPSLMDIPIFKEGSEDLTFSDGTGAVDQSSSRLYISRSLFQDLSLQAYQIPDFSRVQFIFNIFLFSHNTQA